MHKLCSIIVPIYNEEKTIYTCFETIKKQLYKNIEIVFIDDGSTDNSLNIIKKIVKDNPEKLISVYTQQNLGAAAARKKGIENAQGEYIAILDCDDELSVDAIADTMRHVENQDIDIFLFHMKFQKKSESKFYDFQYFTTEKNFYGLDALKNTLEYWGVHGLGVYRKSIFLKSYKDYEVYNKDQNYLNNDEIITRINFLNSNRIILTNGVYLYKNNINSTTKRVNQNLFKTILNAKIFEKIIADKKNNIDTSNYMMSNVWMVYRNFLKNRKEIKNNIDWKDSIAVGLVSINKPKVFFNLSLKSKIKYLIVICTVWMV